MVNSNYYGMDLLYYVPTTSQASRAASVIHYLFRFRSKLDKEQIKPVSVLIQVYKTIVLKVLNLSQGIMPVAKIILI